jgi:putative Mn2+ efflux pump MntP
MSLPTLLLIALGVSADAFAVAIGKGLQMRRFDPRQAAALAVTFGLFQALMPLLGYLLGTGLERYITEVDHWVAFALLGLVGARMIREALRADPHDGVAGNPALHPRELLVLGVATSIDALAVGIGFAFLEVNVALAVALIGVITLLLSFGGVALGQRAGARYRRPAEIVGGGILIAIGTKILLNHLGVL